MHPVYLGGLTQDENEGGTMPWHVEKMNDEWCVVKDETSTSVGCHQTRAQANEQMAALYASEAASLQKVAAADDVVPVADEQPSMDTTGMGVEERLAALEAAHHQWAALWDDITSRVGELEAIASQLLTQDMQVEDITGGY